jgi:hypothetical protein
VGSPIEFMLPSLSTHGRVDKTAKTDSLGLGSTCINFQAKTLKGICAGSQPFQERKGERAR